MTHYAEDFSPTNTDFENIALNIVEQDPDELRVRGPSNNHGDDGIHRNTATGGMTVTEAKFYRQNRNVPKKDIDNLNEAAASTSDLYGAPAIGKLFTTAEGLSKDAKALLRKINKDGDVLHVFLFEDLKRITENPATHPDTSFALGRALQQKARSSRRAVNL